MSQEKLYSQFKVGDHYYCWRHGDLGVVTREIAAMAVPYCTVEYLRGSAILICQMNAMTADEVISQEYKFAKDRPEYHDRPLLDLKRCKMCGRSIDNTWLHLIKTHGHDPMERVRTGGAEYLSKYVEDFEWLVYKYPDGKKRVRGFLEACNGEQDKKSKRFKDQSKEN